MGTETVRVFKDTTVDTVKVLGVIDVSVPPFDPGTLPLTAWLRDYTTSLPFAGSASAGTSGSNSFVSAGSDPGLSALNAHPTAVFNGSSNILGTSGDLGTYAGAAGTAWSAVCLFKTNTVAAGATFPYDDPCFIMDRDGIWGISHTTLGVRCLGYDGTDLVGVAASDPGAGSWHVAQMYYNGSHMFVRMDSGAWVDAGALGSGWGGQPMLPLNIGTSWNLSHYYDGEIAELMIADSALTTTDFDNIKGYLNTRYGLSL